MIPHGAVALCRNDDRLISPCCRAGQTVVFGELINPGGADWSQRFDRYCSACEKLIPIEQWLDGPGTGWMERFPNSDWKPKNRPEGT